MKYDYNLIIIGGGAAGLVSAIIGSTLQAKVALIEKASMGGDCLNTGCVPSKTLIKTAKVLHQMKNAGKFGIREVDFNFDFSDVMSRVKKAISTIAPNDSVDRFTSLGVDCFQGEAVIIDKHTVTVNGKNISSKNIILSHGAEPFIPPIEGLSDINYLTSENLWEIDELPENLLILGGGPIGVEMAQCFKRLGSNVTIVEKSKALLPREQTDVSDVLTSVLIEEGVNVYTGLRGLKVVKGSHDNTLVCQTASNDTKEICFDKILIASGRRARSIRGSLKDLGIRLRQDNSIDVDAYMRANGDNIFACGDVTGPFQFTHVASHQAFYCVFNALFPFLRRKVNYDVVPYVTYTDPEIAKVGMDETMAKKSGVSYHVHTHQVSELDRAITESETKGFIKVLTKPGSDKLLGVTIVAHNAGEMITEFTLALKHNIGLNKILGTIHPYPTMSEGNKFVAGAWKRTTVSKLKLMIAKKYMTLIR